jgi:hypothetical protein
METVAPTEILAKRDSGEITLERALRGRRLESLKEVIHILRYEKMKQPIICTFA